MWHMPYERMQVGDEAEDTPDTVKQHPLTEETEPGHTPHMAEGDEGEERKMPVDEPGRTPGSAEGE